MSETVREGPVYYICPTCDAQGGMGDDCICPDCDGAGYRQAHIIPGANAVVTKEGLEAAAEVVGKMILGATFKSVCPAHRSIALAALKAAGIACS